MMGQLEFISPQFLALLIGVPLMAVFIVWRERQRRGRLRRVADPHLIELLVARISWGRRYWKSVLWLLSMGFVIIALARPTWGVRTDFVETQGVSVYILLDVSQSMNAEDVLPTRLERAKIGIRDISSGIAGNEVGLIVFAGSAFVVFPLTTDAESAQTFLTYVSTNSVSRQGTAIGTAIELALDAFDSASASEKVIVLASDGEDQTDDVDMALERASDLGIPVHVLGYGTDGGGSIPIRNSEGLVVGNKRDRTGNIVITRINDGMLQRIADRTGGIYERVDVSDVGVSRIIQSINAMEGSALGEDEQNRGVERFALFALIALVFLSIEMLTTESRE